MDTKLLCRAYRKSTRSWLSLVLPDELSSKEQKAIWIEDICGEHFQPKQIQSIPKDLVDEVLTKLPMRKLEKNDGQDTDDSWRGDSSED